MGTTWWWNEARSVGVECCAACGVVARLARVIYQSGAAAPRGLLPAFLGDQRFSAQLSRHLLHEVLERRCGLDLAM